MRTPEQLAAHRASNRARQTRWRERHPEQERTNQARKRQATRERRRLVVSVYDAAHALGYSSYYLRDLVQRRTIRATKVKGAWVIPLAEVERLRRVSGPLVFTTAPAACAGCGTAFDADVQRRQRYCSERCQHRAYMRQRRAA